ncbi:MAG TPA: hypothetical protein VHC49_15675 [Mycobacteriales bacterium]|nr:hypothetical protein [Mycobacteriales bacterium]
MRGKAPPGSRQRAAAIVVAVLAGVAVLSAAIGAGRSAPADLQPLASSGPTPAPTTGASHPCTVSATLVPSCGAWWGVAPGSWTDQSRLQATQEFEAAAGRRMAVVHTYHRDSGLFPTAEEIALAREAGKTRLLYINWKPELGHTWAQVAAGAVDSDIDREAAYLKQNFPERFFLAIHHEPENEVDERPGSGFTAIDYHDMFRHVVERLRHDGVSNAVYVMNYMAAEKWMAEPWFDQLYPGDDVVDWIAFDRYSSTGSAFPRLSFSELVNRGVDGRPGFYTWAQEHHPGKPLALGEWGVYDNGEDPAYKAAFFDDMKNAVSAFPNLRMYLYFDAPSEPRHGDSTITTTPEAQKAFRDLGELPYFSQLP